MGGGKKQTLGYKYLMGLHMVVCKGPCDAFLGIRASDRTALVCNVTDNAQVYIDAPDLFGGTKREGGIQGFLDCMFGGPTQVKNDYLVAQLGSEQPAYRGVMSFVFRRGMVAAMNPYLKPWEFRVRRLVKGWESGVAWYPLKAAIDVGGGILCANAAHILYEVLTDTEDGMGYPTSAIDDANFRDAANLFHLEGLGLFVTWVRSERLEDFIRNILDHVNATLVQDPKTLKFQIVAMRDDYLLSSLMHFGPRLGPYTVPCTLEEFERATPDETINETTTKWTNSSDGSDGSITLQQLANIQAAGAVINQAKEYACCPTEAIGRRLGERDLLLRSSLLARVRIRADRRAANLVPGKVIKLTWPALDIVEMPIRVMRVVTGNQRGGEVSIEGIEDVFGFSNSVYLAPSPTPPPPPTQTPAASTAVEAFEAPFRDLVQILTLDVAKLLAPDAGFVGMAVLQPPGVPINFQLLTRPGAAAYVDQGAGDFTPTATISAAVTRAGTSLAVTNASRLDQLAVGSAAFLGPHPTAEVVRIDGIAGNTITVGRGCLDTVAQPWPIGTRLWGYDEFGAAAATEYIRGEVISAKALTNASTGRLSEAAAPTDTVTMAGRASRPYPPQGVTIGGLAEPASATGSLAIAWRHRDRILQSDTILSDTAASVGPEETVRYALRFLNGVGGLITERLNITGTSATVELAYTGQVTMELFAISDRGESWQRHSRTFTYTPSAGAPPSSITAAGYVPPATIIDGGAIT